MARKIKKEKSGAGGLFLIMLIIALIIDAISAFFGLIELLIGGAIPFISSFINFIGTAVIGTWLYFRKRKEITENLAQRLLARLGISSAVELIPIINVIIPTWTINVLSVLEYRRILYLIMIAGITFVPIMLIVLYNFLQPKVCANPTGQCQGFDESKLAKYEQECNGSHVDIGTVTAPSAKEYAISIGVPAEDIKVWNIEEVRTMIKEEIAKQWSQLSEAEKHGSTQQQAQRAILSYAHHEGGLEKFTTENGQIVPKHDQTTFFPLSITIDKYKGCKNKQYAVAWDIKYAIYLGVKENFDVFKSNKVSGEGEERWKNTIGYVFLPSDPSCYWTGGGACRSDVSNKEWNAPYNNEPAYVCQGIGGDVSPAKKELLSTEAKRRIESAPCYKENYNGNSGSSCSDGGMFGASRDGGRRHAGIDITVPPGACPRTIISNPNSAPGQCKVYAVADGKVIAYYKDFFDSTDAVLIDHGQYVINYTEIAPLVNTGQEVKAGQHIGNIIANTGAGSAMLHFEIYSAGTQSNLHWYGNDNQKPAALLDPHSFLRELLNK